MKLREFVQSEMLRCQDDMIRKSVLSDILEEIDISTNGTAVEWIIASVKYRYGAYERAIKNKNIPEDDRNRYQNKITTFHTIIQELKDVAGIDKLISMIEIVSILQEAITSVTDNDEGCIVRFKHSPVQIKGISRDTFYDFFRYVEKLLQAKRSESNGELIERENN